MLIVVTLSTVDIDTHSHIHTHTACEKYLLPTQAQRSTTAPVIKSSHQSRLLICHQNEHVFVVLYSQGISVCICVDTHSVGIIIKEIKHSGILLTVCQWELDQVHKCTEKLMFYVHLYQVSFLTAQLCLSSNSNCCT